MSGGARTGGTARRVSRATGRLATTAVSRMEERLPWFQAMPPEQRSWVGLVVQTGIAGFVEWLRRPQAGTEITGEAFAAAPPEMARAVTLEQTVDLVRMAVDVVEEAVPELAAPGEEEALREAVLRYSREVAFAAAGVYARAAEQRGAWDARLEALVVDGVLRGEADDVLLSRAAALGWTSPRLVAVLVGSAPRGEPETILDAVQAAAARDRLDALAGVQGDRLVAVVGSTDDPVLQARAVVVEFGDGPVVVGPTVLGLAQAGMSARAALAGLRAAPAWPTAPRPVRADDLLPERALAGDDLARHVLVEDVYMPLIEAGPAVLDTVTVYVESAGSLEATARLLFVHPNTVRYRLRRAANACGYDATTARDAFVLHVAMALGRLASSEPADTPL